VGENRLEHYERCTERRLDQGHEFVEHGLCVCGSGNLILATIQSRPWNFNIPASNPLTCFIMPSPDQKSDLKDVIVFASPGLLPDVRLKVFGTWEFHVHSVVLKLYSAFFRKFLDPSNKEEAAPATLGIKFRYEWVTEIDEDGNGWHLISESSKASICQATRALLT
jgi:hypothetical protein